MSDSSTTDTLRSAAPLRHARTWISKKTLELENGGQLSDVHVCFETWGKLDKDASNAVLIPHAISGDSHVTRHEEDDEPGWWELLVGPGKPIDTNLYFVICSNVLGGCRGTTGPNFENPETETAYGAEFPVVTVRDMVEIQKRLVDELGIQRLRAVVGGSLGGFQALTWAIVNPERVGACIVLAAAPRLSSQGIAFDVVGRNAIRHDPCFAGGQYYGGPSPEAGLALARMLAHITYLSDESMRTKFDPTRLQPRSVEGGFESTFSVGSYLAHQGGRFVERFDANSYITLSTAMDLFDLGDTWPRARSVPRTGDLSLALPQLLERLALSTQKRRTPTGRCTRRPARQPVSSLQHRKQRRPRLLSPRRTHASRWTNDRLDARQRIRHLGSDPVSPKNRASRTPTSIFYAQATRLRNDPAPDARRSECRRPRLRQRRTPLDPARPRPRALFAASNATATPWRNASNEVSTSIHADLEQGLPAIPDQSFEVALLSQTLQSIIDVVGVLDEVVRIGRRGIVSFPNFAYLPMREMFATEWPPSENRRPLRLRLARHAESPLSLDPRLPGALRPARNPHPRSHLCRLDVGTGNP